MLLTLIVPELIWPEPSDRDTLEALACPGLNRLLARSRVCRRPPQSVEATVCETFDLYHNAAYAAFRVLGENNVPPSDGCWICADPVHLRLHQEKLILAGGASLAIHVAEAQSIVAELNRHFADTGIFHLAAADRWYLQLPAGTDFAPFDVLPLSAVIGRRVGKQLPETPPFRRLRQLLNEVQMVLHHQEVNQKREENGQSTINSLWLWGGGVRPSVAASVFTAVWSDEPLTRGLARACDLPVRPSPDAAETLFAQTSGEGHHLVVLDALQEPVQYEDRDAYRANLARLDACWFTPLQKALTAGRIRRLRVDASTAYATLRWESTRREQWQFWRQPRPLAVTAATLAKGEQ